MSVSARVTLIIGVMPTPPAIMMVSRLRFPKAVLRKNHFINAFQIVNIALIYYCGVFRTWPEYLLAMGTFTLIAGIIAGRITRGSA